MVPTSEATSELHFSYINLQHFATNRIAHIVPKPTKKKWLQWTQSPPAVADLNGDGKNEVICAANVEMDVPYDTKHHSLMALEGSYGDRSRSARRLTGWEQLPSLII